MHARNRTWPLGSDPAERCRQRTLPVEGGDGSTLSLDFTTGVLDPRLTFQRLGNATFINSSGLVQYADANMVVNADLVGAGTGNTPTAWTGSAGINLTIPATGVRRAATTTAAQNWIQSATFSTVQGLTYSTSVLVSEVSGQHYANTVGITGGATVVQYYRNGSTVGQFDTAVAGLITVVWTATTTNTHNVRCGIGSTGANVANATCEFTQPRTVVGNIAQPAYFANSSTTAAYHAPRFDYDPTAIGTPRGLLIEGAGDNRVTQSESFSSWTLASAALGATASGPDGNTSSALTLREDNANNMHACVLTSRTVTSGSPATFSVFVKAGASPRRYILIRVNDNASNANAASVMWDTQARTISGAATAYGTFTNVSATRTEYAATSWDRIALTFTPSTATIACKLELSDNGSRSADGQSVAYLGNNSSGVLIWGAQLELGSGASSYIPTGASTGSRAADNCYIYDTTSSGGLSWFKTATQGTFYVEMFKRSAGTAFAAAGYGTRGTATQDFMLYQAVGNNWLSFNWGINENIVNYTALSSPFLIKSAAALSPRVGTPTTADVLQSINGTAGTLNTSPNVTLPFTSDLFCIGSRGPAGGTASSQNYAETAIRRIKFFPFAMTAAQMNALTTL